MPEEQDEQTTYPYTCGECGRLYQWSADDIAWQYETPFLPCGHSWKLLQTTEQQDRRIFEIKSIHADEPEADRTYYRLLREVREEFPSIYELVKPTAFCFLSYTVDLDRIEVRDCTGEIISTHEE